MRLIEEHLEQTRPVGVTPPREADIGFNPFRHTGKPATPSQNAESD